MYFWEVADLISATGSFIQSTVETNQHTMVAREQSFCWEDGQGSSRDLMIAKSRKAEASERGKVGLGNEV